MIKKNKPLNMSQDEIQAWEEKDKNGRKAQTWDYADDHEDPITFVVVPPKQSLLFAIADVSDKDNQKATHMLINGCVLAGPMELLEKDTGLLLGLAEDLGELVEVKKKKRAR